MGYLHAGHLSLIRCARRAVGKGIVVVSIYVNPTQFAPTEDFRNYPRDLARDRALCRAAGVDVLFAPSDREMYPDSEKTSTYVVEEELSQRMEGASRPTHFRGVATVVAKLFHLVRPNVAVFGAKDYQQAAVIRRMVRDLNFPVKILVAPTVRESDGLAMSSRNKYLVGGLRFQARVLVRALRAARAAVKKSRNGVESGELIRQLTRQIEAEPDARLDYIEFFHPETLRKVDRVRAKDHMALAVFVGRTRLIDNAPLG
jgi:pantoate--beta-alanine ligase